VQIDFIEKKMQAFIYGTKLVFTNGVFGSLSHPMLYEMMHNEFIL
jgi:hypothetical protein